MTLSLIYAAGEQYRALQQTAVDRSDTWSNRSRLDRIIGTM